MKRVTAPRAGSDRLARKLRSAGVRLLTELEVAGLLAVSVSHVRRLRAAGELPHVVVGRRAVRYDPEAIRRWISERTVDVNGGPEADERADQIFDDVVREVVR